MPKKIKQYFGIGSQGEIYIEKKWKTFKGDPIKLEKDWKSTQRENTFLKDQITAIQTKLDLYEKVGGIKEQLENRILGLQNAHGETFKSFQDRLNSQERFINQQAIEIGKARNFEKFLRKDTDQLEEKCKSSQGKLKDWSSAQIKKWLKEIEPHFKQVYLPKTYELVNEGFYSWIKLLEAIADPEPAITTTDSLKKVNELILSQNQLNRFLFLQKVANLNELDQKIKVLESNISQKENDLNIILTKWKAKDLTELSANIQTIINERDKNWSDLIKEQNKNKQLEIQITNKDNIISQKDKSIQSLELKNEKLTENYKKLIQFLADARQLISHLQKDLSATQQDKEHIQQELNNALTILNKPTAEMGTQTDLTAEQITQMETQITQYQEQINKEQDKVSNLQTKTVDLQKVIRDLQEKVKELNYNREEMKLLNYTKKEITTSPISFLEVDYKISANSLLQELQDESKWTQLRWECKDIRLKLIELAQNEIAKRDLATKITKLAKDKGELQTKYDMEVRTKEELIKYLSIYRSSPIIPVDLRHQSFWEDEKLMNEYFKSHFGLGWNNLFIYCSDLSLKDKKTFKINLSNSNNLLFNVLVADFILSPIHGGSLEVIIDFGERIKNPLSLVNHAFPCSYLNHQPFSKQIPKNRVKVEKMNISLLPKP